MDSEKGGAGAPKQLDVPPPSHCDRRASSSPTAGSLDSCTSAAPGNWTSPLDNIRRRTANTAAISNVAGPAVNDFDMDAQGVDLSSLGGPPQTTHGRTSSTSRMPFHGNESFTVPPQPASPDIIEGGLVKGRGLVTETQYRLLSDGDSKKSSSRTVSSGTGTFSYPSPGKDPDPSWSHRVRARWWKERWHPSFSMYLSFIFGILCAVGHHIFYASLDGKLAGNQSEMLRYGTILAYSSKAGFCAAVISAFKQRVWVTVRSRFMSIAALDSMFAATENMMAMLSLEFLKDAKGAFALALFAWVTPLVVILTANTLLVVPRTMMHNTTCPGVRTLNFSHEETTDWRNPRRIEGLFEIPMSLWNTTKRDGETDSDWFDYYTGPSPNFQQTATLGAFLEEVVAPKHAAVNICGAGWNCTFTIDFTAPGYQCTEVASGVGSKVSNLTQASGEAVAPFGTDVILPEGHNSYVAFTSGGEYSTTQLAKVGIGGIPNMSPPYPAHLGALRTEPIIWIGYAVLNHPGQTQPTRNQSGWKDAFTPKIMACEHRETAYVANITYVGETQNATIVSQKFGAPVINTTYLPGVMANDETQDNTTATPESNYVYPNDTARYRKVAAYHSLGKTLRDFINGTVAVSDSLVEPIANTAAIQTKLLDEQNNYFPHSDLESRIHSIYQDMILSLFSNPQFVGVVWAARPSEQTGTLLQGGASGDEARYMYPCTRFRTANTYAYHRRDLWIVYGVAAFFTLLCVTAGAFAIRENGGVTRNTRFSSVVAATRGPVLDKIAWRGPLQDRGDVPSDVKKLMLGYGVITDMDRRLAALEVGLDPNLVTSDDEERFGGGSPGSSTVYSSGYVGEVRCGFGLKGDVDQRHREGSLFRR